MTYLRKLTKTERSWVFLEFSSIKESAVSNAFWTSNCRFRAFGREHRETWNNAVSAFGHIDRTVSDRCAENSRSRCLISRTQPALISGVHCHKPVVAITSRAASVPLAPMNVIEAIRHYQAGSHSRVAAETHTETGTEGVVSFDEECSNEFAVVARVSAAHG